MKIVTQLKSNSSFWAPGGENLDYVLYSQRIVSGMFHAAHAVIRARLLNSIDFGEEDFLTVTTCGKIFSHTPRPRCVVAHGEVRSGRSYNWRIKNGYLELVTIGGYLAGPARIDVTVKFGLHKL